LVGFKSRSGKFEVLVLLFREPIIFQFLWII